MPLSFLFCYTSRKRHVTTINNEVEGNAGFAPCKAMISSITYLLGAFAYPDTMVI